MDSRPRVFVGSATESLHVAEAFHAVLPSDDLEVTLWPDIFNVGEYLLEDLLEAANATDFAVFVFAPDDELTSRGQQMTAPRDNVVFELGVFASTLGPRRTFVVKAEGESVKVPSDLAGVSYGTYKAPDANAIDGRWESALRTTARKIRRAIDRAQTLQTAARTVTARDDPREGTATLVSPQDLIARDLTSAARQGRLFPVGEPAQGSLVVHALHGVGQVLGYDPPGTPARAVRVRFSTGVGLVAATELYAATPDLQADS